MRLSFASDLTDDEWSHLHRTVFAGTTASADLRAVVDGLLYQRRSAFRFDHLPPGFPDAATLLATRRAWNADGTWEKVFREMIACSEAAAARALSAKSGLFQTLRKLKRGAGNWLRRIPGGMILLCPARWALRLARAARRIARGRRRGPANVNDVPERAWQAIQDERFEDADSLLTRWAEACPLLPDPVVCRAAILERLGRFDEARTECWRAAVLPNRSARQAEQIHGILSRCFAIRHDFDRASGHLLLEKALGRLDKAPDEMFARVDLAADALSCEWLIEAFNDLAAHVINTFSDFETAFELYRRKEAIQERYAARYPLFPSRTLCLGPDWGRNIGHMALLDFWLKMAHMGWRDWKHFVLIAPEMKVANAAYAECYKPHYTIVSDPHVAKLMQHFTETIGHRVASRLELPDGRETYFLNGMGVIQEEWERQGRAPLLTLTPEHQEFGRRQLRSMGVPDDGWFVCLHVRSPGYHQEGDNPHQSHRNAEILSYIPAIREIVRRGGWVIRLGDSTMPPLSKMPGVIDFARSDHKSELMDIYLCASCRFFVGVASGISHVPTTFGVPTVMTNWVSNAFPVYSRLDLFLPKLLWSNATGRFLSFGEALAPESRLMSYSGVTLMRHGLRAIDNTEDELRDVIVEMFQRLDGRDDNRPEDRLLLQRFDRLARMNGLMGFSKIGRDFLHRHAGLLIGADEAVQDESSRSARTAA